MPLYATQNTTKLDGKIVVITGANTGIGKETARDLCRRGARVIILCRNEQKAEAAAEEIRQDTKGIIEFQKLDLSSLQMVRECADRLNETLDKIDILINNAGWLGPKMRTVDGNEMTFATNHLGHFLLTQLLLPLLKKSAASGFRPRIVIVSSLGHRFAPIKWDDINSEQSYGRLKVYFKSKLANVLHAKELARRLNEENAGISVYVLHPGTIATELGRDETRSQFAQKLSKMFKRLMKTPVQGTQTTLYCCLEESIANDSGKYYSDCKETRPHSRALIEDDQKRLWDLSEKMVGLKTE